MKTIMKFLPVLLIVVLGFAATKSIFAQEDNQMLFVPSNILDQLSSATATNSYYLEVTEAQVISLEILTLTETYSPSFAVYNSAGEFMPVIADAMSGWGVDMKVTLPEAGTYRIFVGALDAGYGDYLLRITKIGSYENHEYGLPLDSAIGASIVGNQVMHRYDFAAQPNEALTLYVLSDMNNPNISLSLTNQTRNQEAGAMDSPVGASSFCIPAGTDNYTLDLMSAQDSVESQYGLLLVSNPTENCAQTSTLAELETAIEINSQNAASSANSDTSETANHGGGDESTVREGNCDTDSEALSETDVNAQACADVDVDLVDTEVDADACAGLDVNAVGVNADVCADVNVDIGDTDIDANVDVNANVGNTDVDASVDVNGDTPAGADDCDGLDVNATVGGVNAGACVDVNIDIGNIEVDPNLDVDVNLPHIGLP